MPGILDVSRPKASFISPWAIYRAAVAASDDLGHPDVVAQVIDLTDSFNGIDSEIWITPILDSGGGTVNLTLVLVNNGSLAPLQPYLTVAAVASVGSGVLQKFAGLVAGVYYVLLTLSDTASWDIHYAVVSRAFVIPPGVVTPAVGIVAGSQLLTGLWANPNGNIAPANTAAPALYYEDSAGIVNDWRWSVANQNWFAVVTS